MANKIIKTSSIKSNRILVHYGVNGMRWGVQKDIDKGGRRGATVNALKQPLATRQELLTRTSLIRNEYHQTIIDAVSKDQKYGERYRQLPESYKFTADSCYAFNKKQFDTFMDNLESYISNNDAVSSFSELDRLSIEQSTMENSANPELTNDLTDELYKAFEDMINDQQLTDEKKAFLMEYASNCSNCMAAYEMRRRGYDVEAMPYCEGITNNVSSNPENSFGLSSDMEANFKSGFKWNSISSFKLPFAKDESSSTRLSKQILKYSSGKDQRGYITTSGHIFNYEVKNNKVNYIDVQNAGLNNKSTIKIIDQATIKDTYFARTDNLELDISILSRVRKRND